MPWLSRLSPSSAAIGNKIYEDLDRVRLAERIDAVFIQELAASVNLEEPSEMDQVLRAARFYLDAHPHAVITDMVSALRRLADSAQSDGPPASTR